MPEPELRLTDYRRIFAVVSRCESATTMREFRELLPDAIDAAFGIFGLTMMTGDTMAALFHDQEPLLTSGVAKYRDEYQERWVQDDIFARPDALSIMASTRAVSLTQLGRRPGTATQRYVDEFLFGHGSNWAGAMHIDLAQGRHGVIGLYGCLPDHPWCAPPPALQLLARQLTLITRHLPEGPDSLTVWDRLPSRQLEVARLVGEGYRNAAIASTLGLSEDTVKKYVSYVLAQTGCRNRTELALRITKWSDLH